MAWDAFGCEPTLLSDRRRQAAARHHGHVQAEPLPLAPHGRPGLAHTHSRLPAAHHQGLRPQDEGRPGGHWRGRGGLVFRGRHRGGGGLRRGPAHRGRTRDRRARARRCRHQRLPRAGQRRLPATPGALERVGPVQVDAEPDAGDSQILGSGSRHSRQVIPLGVLPRGRGRGTDVAVERHDPGGPLAVAARHEAVAGAELLQREAGRHPQLEGQAVHGLG
mmetsp:Transcript_101208/g.263916  ORF Transcript_101208/g.263916 Transcript_101208/m.263916 type:complete len:220 (-) Transcript_101208:582-1241(-)